MTDTEGLKEIIQKSGLKMKFLAQKLNLSDFGFSNKVNNVTEFKASEIDSLCEILQIKALSEKERIFFAKRVECNSTLCN